MITAKELYHTCKEGMVGARWDRGKWVNNTQIVTKCPICKESLPEVKQLNQVGVATFYWRPNHMSSDLIPYDGIVLSVKEPIKRKKRAKNKPKFDRALAVLSTSN